MPQNINLVVANSAEGGKYVIERLSENPRMDAIALAKEYGQNNPFPAFVPNKTYPNRYMIATPTDYVIFFLEDKKDGSTQQ